ncbi:MAG TPA: response regulator [Polyangiaceae bacterium]|nr:response regulator [Polyangiaceae bacterium]
MTKQPSEAPSAERTPWREALTAGPLHDPPRVLVAEDDPEMRRLVCEALRDDGYQVTSVGDGGRLLVMLAHEMVDDDGADLADLVLSDVRMPVCTGIQILEQLRAVRCRVPFILMTAFGDSASRDHARSLGAILFDKPFELDDLRTAVALLLRRDAAP